MQRYSYSMLRKSITLLCDQSDSFFLNHITKAQEIVEKFGYNFDFINDKSRIKSGYILFAAAARSILSSEELSKHEFNVVLHPSKLPQYRGSGVVAWSILDGASELWVTSFIATKELDLGPIVWQSSRNLNGLELMDEIRALQAELFLEHINYVLGLEKITGTPQERGKSSQVYRRRSQEDSRLDIEESLGSQFNLLRTVDNLRYPAFFDFNGERFYLFISKKQDFTQKSSSNE